MDNLLEDQLTLEYHGPLVELGRMDSYTVAANIIAFSDFLGILSRITFGEKIELKTEIQGIRKNSFDIDFVLHIGGILAALLSTTPMSMKDIITLMKDSLNVWIFLKGLPPKEVKPSPDKQNLFQVENQNGQIIYVTADVVNVIADPRAGKATEQFIRKPLEFGISHLLIKSSSFKEVAKVEEKDALCFKPIDIEKPLTVNEMRMGLQVESPTFKEGNKWKFFDGQNSFFADILDEEFLARVDQGIERFGKGDTLIATVRISQSTAMGTLRMERAVVKVLEHVIAPEQKKMGW